MEQAAELTLTRRWEGLAGLSVTPQMQGLITAEACLLTVNIGLTAFSDLSTILIEAGARSTTARHSVGGSMVSESEACVIGQAALHGPLRLSWDQVVSDASSNGGTSVVLHEFAHKLDMGDGMVDGTPRIRGHEAAVTFEKALNEVLESLRDGKHGGPLRSYAATNRAELFAVATEAFFLQPTDLKAGFPRLYGVMAGYYRQDPAGFLIAGTK